MGVCHSTLCRLQEDSVVLGTKTDNKRPSKFHRPGLIATKYTHSSIKHYGMTRGFSPTVTEATTPASDTLPTPGSMAGPLSLSSVISTGAFTFEEAGARDPTRDKLLPDYNHFNSTQGLEDLVIMEEEDPDAPSDEEEFHEFHHNNLKQEGTQGLPKGFMMNPEDVITNPPLIIPPKEKTTAFLKAAQKSKKSSTSGRMLREFQRLKQRADSATRQMKADKRRAKLAKRREDVDSYHSLWEEYQDMEKLQKLHSARKDISTERDLPLETRDDSIVEQVRHEREPRFSVRRSNSFDLQDTESWYVDFRKSKHSSKAHDNDDASCQSELSLLSEASMEAQKSLYAEKRRQREAKKALKKKRHEGTASLKSSITSEPPRGDVAASSRSEPQTLGSKGSKDYETYFQELLNGTENTKFGTPLLSPPRLDVVTDQSKITLEANDYGPPKQSRLCIKRINSLTNMEVEVPSDEKKPTVDDTSGITDADFEGEYVMRRRAWRGYAGSRNHNTSMGSSIISYGGLHSSLATVDDKENIDPRSNIQKHNAHITSSERHLEESAPTDAEQMEHDAFGVPTEKSNNSCFQQKVSSTLGDRITDLEKRMGIIPPNDAAAKLEGNQLFCCDTTNKYETFQILAIAQNGGSSAYRSDASPVRTPCSELQNSPINGNGMAQHSPELEPTKLQEIFDASSEAITSASDRQASGVRERIVMGNCNFTHESIAFMTTEDFRRISTDHALVRWERGSFIYQDEDANEENENKKHSSSCIDSQNEGFLNEIAEEVEEVLSRYRNDSGVIDVHELAIQHGNMDVLDADQSFSAAQGRLYSA